MKKTNLLYSGFVVLSFSMITFFVKNMEPQINHLKCVGGTGEENIFYVIKLKDGNYLSCGFTESHNGDFNATGGTDAFLVKTDGAGNIIWKKTYGGGRDEVFYNI